MNEEVADKSVHLAVQTGKLTARVLYRALEKKIHEMKTQKAMAKNKPAHGKQSVKELIGQGQGVASMPISEEIRAFKRSANKYGVDFAIVKDKEKSPPVYTVFFKAKDVDAIELVLRDYSKKLFKKGKIADKDSVLEKLNKYKEQVKNTPRKEHEKRKEQER